MWKSIRMIAVNCIFTLPLMVLLNLYIDNWQVKMDMSIESLPDSFTLLASIVFMMIFEDLGLHFMHRMFHIKWLYPYFHKMHHNYYSPVGIASEYLHPVDFAVGSAIPAGIGAMILGSKLHVFTFLIYGFARTSETVDAHSGYEFSWSPFRMLPFATSAKYHDFHHSVNIGNFSS